MPACYPASLLIPFLVKYTLAVTLVSEIDYLLSHGYHLTTCDGRKIFHFLDALAEIEAGNLLPIPWPTEQK